MTRRWPIHPAPQPGEALSSWTSRLAEALCVDIGTLLSDAAGKPVDPQLLDTDPPPRLLHGLATRTRMPAGTIAAMSIAGYRPWLIEQVTPTGSDGFDTYTRQLSVLIAPGRRRRRDTPAWRAWRPAKPPLGWRMCPQCVITGDASDAKRQPYQLMWSIPLMRSCPEHRCHLVVHSVAPGCYPARVVPAAEPTPRAVHTMDAYTAQGLTHGYVDLPRRRVHAGIWFRLLRTIIDELGATIAEGRSAAHTIRTVWQGAGYRWRAGHTYWHPYEDMTIDCQHAYLEAAAIAIDRLQHGTITGAGHHARLFQTPPSLPVPHGHPRHEVQHDTNYDTPGCGTRIV